MRAGATNREKALGIDLLAATVAARARDGTAPRFGALSLAARANFELGHLDLDCFAERRFLESQSQVVTEVVASGRPVTSAPALLAKDIAEAENLAEQVAEVHCRGIEAAARGAGKSLMAVCVIGRALLRV